MDESFHRWRAEIWYGSSLEKSVDLFACSREDLSHLAENWLFANAPAAFGNASLKAHYTRSIYYYADEQIVSGQTAIVWYCVDRPRSGQTALVVGTFETAVLDFVSRAIVVSYERDEEKYEAHKQQQQRERDEAARLRLERLEAERLETERQRVAQLEAKRIEIERREAERLAHFQLEKERREAAQRETEAELRKQRTREVMRQTASRRLAERRRDAIRQFVNDKSIRQLVHFTRVENLESILQEGLVSREYLKRRGDSVNYIINDHERFDAHLDAVCVSIEFPNYKLFYTFRANKKQRWAVLTLAPSILWELDCLFCITNAASDLVRHDADDERRSVEALNALYEDYEENGQRIRRNELGLPSSYPTNPQAEVLVLESIPQKYFIGVHFETKAEADAISKGLKNGLGLKFGEGKRFFSPRIDHSYWKSKTA